MLYCGSCFDDSISLDQDLAGLHDSTILHIEHASRVEHNRVRGRLCLRRAEQRRPHCKQQYWRKVLWPRHMYRMVTSRNGRTDNSHWKLPPDRFETHFALQKSSTANNCPRRLTIPIPTESISESSMFARWLGDFRSSD